MKEISEILSDLESILKALNSSKGTKEYKAAGHVQAAIEALEGKRRCIATTPSQPVYSQDAISLTNFIFHSTHFLEVMKLSSKYVLMDGGKEKWSYFRDIPMGWSPKKSISLTASQLHGPRERMVKLYEEYDHIRLFRYKRLVGHLLKSSTSH